MPVLNEGSMRIVGAGDVWVVGGGMNTARGPITVLKARTVPAPSLYSGQHLEVGNPIGCVPVNQASQPLTAV